MTKFIRCKEEIKHAEQMAEAVLRKECWTHTVFKPTRKELEDLAKHYQSIEALYLRIVERANIV